MIDNFLPQNIYSSSQQLRKIHQNVMVISSQMQEFSAFPLFREVGGIGQKIKTIKINHSLKVLRALTKL